MAGAEVIHFTPKSIDDLIGVIRGRVWVNLNTGLYKDPWKTKVDPSDAFYQAINQLQLHNDPEKEFEARHWYGEHLAHSKRFDEAIEQFSMCAKLRPKDNELRLTLARLYHLNGQHAESREVYVQLADLPDSTLAARLGNHYHALAENLH